MKRKNKGNIWCRIFGWDKEEWREIVRMWGIRFRWKGHKYIILPGSWLWILIYLIYLVVGAFVFFGPWALVSLAIIVFG